MIESVLRLLRATASREPNFGCFGMHEWAMVYRSEEIGTRHRVPLRLGGGGTDEVVEAHRIQCSHFDAYRFFTPPAIGLNTLSPTAQDREAFEQPACLHGNMDLYKHAFRLHTLIPSDLLADAFELAWDIRILDMRAAPYDMSGRCWIRAVSRGPRFGWRPPRASGSTPTHSAPSPTVPPRSVRR